MKKYAIYEADKHSGPILVRDTELFARGLNGDVQPGLNDLYPNTWLEIDLSALESNVKQIQSVLGAEIGMIAVAKSDAYGHGLVVVANNLVALGANIIGVANLADALLLRKQGISAPVMLIYPVLAEDTRLAVQNNIDITISTLEAAADIASASAEMGLIARIHLQLETGMHNYGADEDAALIISSFIQDSKHLVLAGISTHYSSVDTDKAFAEAQHSRWLSTLGKLAADNIIPEMVHAANSAAFDLFPPSWDAQAYEVIFPGVKTFVRLGSMIYGTYKPKFIPVNSEYIASGFKTKVIEVKTIAAGDSVGYFNSYSSRSSRSIAILALGWGANGYFPENGHVYINDQKSQILGAISANTCAVDVSGIYVVPGDVASIFDNTDALSGTIEDLAEQHNTFVNRIVATLGGANPRVYFTTSKAEGSLSQRPNGLKKSQDYTSY